jgi:hypothetical protein
MATHFYDGQIRRYLLQIIRLLSNFAVKYGDGTLVRIPVTYADPDRQVANIINQNSENTVTNAPKIAVYITDLELDTSRLSDSSYVGKVQVRERAYDETTGEYQPYQGNSYTVERLMPTPYKLSLKVDIWSTSTDQKLQILEQILMLFNPSLEIQTTDNYLDWTSLSVVDLVSTTFSSRSVPTGTADQIDIATIGLSTPIWISPPAKIKRLGVVTNIISNIFSQTTDPYGDYATGLGVDPEASSIGVYNLILKNNTTPGNYDIEVDGSNVRLIGFDPQYPSWAALIQKYQEEYKAGLSRIYLQQPDGGYVVGYFSLNPLDEMLISVQWDPDTYRINDQIASNNRESSGTFDAVIDPLKSAPGSGLPLPTVGTRYLILEDIGGGTKDTFIADTKIQRINTNVLYKKVNGHRVFVDDVEVGSGNIRIPNDFETGNYYITLDEMPSIGSEIRYQLFLNPVPDDNYYYGQPNFPDQNNQRPYPQNTEWGGPDAWKNLDGSDFIAEENDIIEWDGVKWTVIFDADENADQVLNLSNLFTGTQYKWNGVYWTKSFEGFYRKGGWILEL